MAEIKKLNIKNNTETMELELKTITNEANNKNVENE